jgi:hypothetical protein
VCLLKKGPSDEGGMGGGRLVKLKPNRIHIGTKEEKGRKVHMYVRMCDRGKISSVFYRSEPDLSVEIGDLRPQYVRIHVVRIQIFNIQSG